MKRATVTEELAYGTALDRLTGAGNPTPSPPKEKLTRQSPKEEPVKQSQSTMIKLSVFLNREEDAYLENLKKMPI